MTTFIFTFLLFFTFIQQLQGSDNLSSTSPDDPKVHDHEVNLDHGDGSFVVDGETTWDGAHVEGWTSQFPRRFFQLYFNHKTSSTKRSQPLGSDLFDDTEARVPLFPQPHSIRMDAGRFEVQLTSTLPSTTSQQNIAQFDQNTSDQTNGLSGDPKLLTETGTQSTLFDLNETDRKETTTSENVTSKQPKIILIPKRSPPVRQKSVKLSKEQPQCSDTVNDCADRKHLCNSAKYGEIMWRMCPFTCDACFHRSDKPTCVDASPLCARRAGHCSISYYTAIMSRVCPVTCKLC
ncbi:hypothetical protein M3Y97_01003400 [Aphelenchoides bicaudatus]|nr:hypothetical protein M3Y97_01003400 [Aphelenchoides bicaudatus]